jgi:hypothetical protein
VASSVFFCYSHCSGRPCLRFCEISVLDPPRPADPFCEILFGSVVANPHKPTDVYAPGSKARKPVTIVPGITFATPDIIQNYANVQTLFSNTEAQAKIDRICSAYFKMAKTATESREGTFARWW